MGGVREFANLAGGSQAGGPARCQLLYAASISSFGRPETVSTELPPSVITRTHAAQDLHVFSFVRLPALPYPLPINLNPHTSQVHLRSPSIVRSLYPRRQPTLRPLIEEWPLRHHDQECQSCAAQSDVESFVDVLAYEAGEEGDSARSDEEDGCE